MSGPVWMPFYVGDYVGDTLHLTRDQHGAYLLLILAYWQKGGPLQDDDEQLAAIAKASLSQWQTLRKVMAKFFQIRRGFWHHKRIEAELAAVQNTKIARQAAGLKGAEKRWQSHDFANGKRMAKPMANAFPLVSPPLDSPSLTPPSPSPSPESPPYSPPPSRGGNFRKNRNGKHGAEPAETGRPPWEKRCAAWATSGFWQPLWGPTPDEPNCLAPPALIASTLNGGHEPRKPAEPIARAKDYRP